VVLDADVLRALDRRGATRYAKLAANDLAMLHLAAIRLQLQA